MKVKLSEIGRYDLLRLAKNDPRPQLAERLEHSIKLHLSHENASSNSERYERPAWEDKYVYLYPLSEFRIIWSIEADCHMVWFIQRLSFN